MKIHFERSGGFIGRALSTTVDTNELPPEKALRLLAIVEETDFFGLPEPIGVPESIGGADQFCYRVTVEVAGVEKTVETSDPSRPPELEPLITELSRWARQGPPGDGTGGGSF